MLGEVEEEIYEDVSDAVGDFFIYLFIFDDYLTVKNQ